MLITICVILLIIGFLLIVFGRELGLAQLGVAIMVCDMFFGFGLLGNLMPIKQQVIGLDQKLVHITKTDQIIIFIYGKDLCASNNIQVYNHPEQFELTEFHEFNSYGHEVANQLVLINRITKEKIQ